MSDKETRLFREERHTRILELLSAEHRVEVLELSQLFNVSSDTIRRDLRALKKLGLIRKAHGGALGQRALPIPYESRVEQASGFKAAIGREAAKWVEEGDSLIIDSGTTALWLAKSLDVNIATVITNSLEVANVIRERPGLELIVLGGKWDPLHQLVGPTTVECLSRFRVDKLFLGLIGLDFRQGLTAPTLEEAMVKRAMIQVAKKVFALADHTKVGKIGFAWVAAASAVDVLVTDELADCEAFAELRWKIVTAHVDKEREQ